MKKPSLGVMIFSISLSVLTACGQMSYLSSTSTRSQVSAQSSNNQYGYVEPNSASYANYGANTSYSSSSPIGMTAPASTSAGSVYGTYPTGYGQPYPTATAYPAANYTNGSTNFGPGTIGKPNQGQVLTGSEGSPLAAYRNTFFKNYGVNPYVEASTDPLSTFALDVDTAAFSLGRSYLSASQLPPKASVRPEEYLNALDYHYALPAQGNFAIYTDVSQMPEAAADTRLLRIGVQGRQLDEGQRKDAILTFVIDVSGSMNQQNRLELVKQSILQMLPQLRSTDQIGIVIFGSNARVLLPHTPVADRTRIETAVQTLRSEGSTNVDAGLSLAYDQASKMFRNGAINRVILCSDGVANVGETGPEKMLSTIKAKSENGITLTTLGFGMGDFNDTLMEQLADQGDGQYAYIDTLQEAKQILNKNLEGTLQLIAKDAKIQVSFNAQTVDQYRLLGYENRDIADQDFRNDSVDAGDVGAGHSVTALYQIRLKPVASQGELATVSLRYKDVDKHQKVEEVSQKVDLAATTSFDAAPASLRLATAVGQFAEILRESPFAKGSNLNQIENLVTGIQSQQPADQRLRDLTTMVQSAARLSQPLSTQSIETAYASAGEFKSALPDWQSYLLKQLGGKASS